MQLGKALVGAVIGGAIGIGLLVAAYFLFRTEHTGLAILVAVCVGLGVRAMAATKGHAQLCARRADRADRHRGVRGR